MATAVLKITHDDLRPAFQRLQRLGNNTTPVMRSMGNVFKSITEGNFNSAGAGYRPADWPAKKDGSPATLKRSGLLWHGFHLTVTKDTANLSNAAPYAAVHQFGSAKTTGRGSGILARPFYPVINGNLTPAAQEKIAEAGMRVIERANKGT
jgi:phage gpG-like protein